MHALFAILICLPSIMLAQDLQALADQNFNQIDANKDNVILKHELESYFLGLDTNHDQRVSRHEYTVRVTEVYGHDPQLNHLMHALYDELDVNNDHHVDIVDIDNLFDQADRDRNGLVTRAEFSDFFIRAIQIASSG
ncbi:hypothetical protein Btru_070222 [Bulinus truncatus]|nr:hypothetical protein Btru_070222 [Bulinus truncatus]